MMDPRTAANVHQGPISVIERIGKNHCGARQRRGPQRHQRCANQDKFSHSTSEQNGYGTNSGCSALSVSETSAKVNAKIRPSVPEGHATIAQRFQRWVESVPRSSSPEGTTEM